MVVAEVRYRYRLRMNADQERLLQGVFDACRAVWNQALGRWGDLWRHEGESLYYRDADRELTDWRGRFEWLAAQPSVPQQQVLRDLYRAISAFFDTSNSAGRPRFKARKAGYATARWTRNGFAVSGSGLGRDGDRLRVAVAGGRIALRVVWSRPLPSEPTSVTVCARPVELDCHFESICESCTFFVTTIEFKPTLQRQRDDAETKGQIGRQKIFDGLLARLDDQAC